MVSSTRVTITSVRRVDNFTVAKLHVLDVRRTMSSQTSLKECCRRPLETTLRHPLVLRDQVGLRFDPPMHSSIKAFSSRCLNGFLKLRTAPSLVAIPRKSGDVGENEWDEAPDITIIGIPGFC